MIAAGDVLLPYLVRGPNTSGIFEVNFVGYNVNAFLDCVTDAQFGTHVIRIFGPPSVPFPVVSVKMTLLTDQTEEGLLSERSSIVVSLVYSKTVILKSIVVVAPARSGFYRNVPHIILVSPVY